MSSAYCNAPLLRHCGSMTAAVAQQGTGSGRDALDSADQFVHRITRQRQVHESIRIEVVFARTAREFGELLTESRELVQEYFWCFHGPPSSNKPINIMAELLSHEAVKMKLQAKTMGLSGGEGLLLHLGRRAVIWAVLVVGCAAPLISAMSETLSRDERIAVAAGVAVWIAAMVVIEQRRLRSSRSAAEILVPAALVFVTLQGVVAVAAPTAALFAFYSPAVILASRLLLMPTGAGATAMPSAFVLTLACGGQVLAAVLGVGWLLSKRPAR